MSYRGLMDGWYGDETDCLGDCGSCESCEQQYYLSCDEEYDAWRDEVI